MNQGVKRTAFGVLFLAGSALHAAQDLPQTRGGLAAFAEQANNSPTTTSADPIPNPSVEVVPSSTRQAKPLVSVNSSGDKAAVQAPQGLSQTLKAPSQTTKVGQFEVYQPHGYQSAVVPRASVQPQTPTQPQVSVQPKVSIQPKAQPAASTVPNPKTSASLEAAVSQAFTKDTQDLFGTATSTSPKSAATPQASNVQTVTSAAPALPAPVKQPVLTDDTKFYTVQRGDTLSSLAAKGSINLVYLAAMNGLSPTSGLVAGQKLKVPLNFNPTQAKTVAVQSSAKAKAKPQVKAEVKPEVKAESKAATTLSPKPSLPQSYKVKSGDSLTGLAARFGVDLHELAKQNQLSPTADLLIGQTLVIDTSSFNQSYKVKPGDGLIQLASKLGVSTQELAEQNNLSANAMLQVSQTLKVPSLEALSEPQAQRSSSAPTTSYTVKSGEGLIMLAQRFGVSTEELAELNGLSTRANLLVGQRLKVPELYETYKVRSGDGLIRLAQRYNISAAELAELNQIPVLSELRIGQSLKVPRR